MSSELLRIHDENNNCDLVAVANPMGNFHMSTYAEMQDGTQKPVDGWYLFSKMIEKLGQGGGGGWPADMPVPSAGGYGYTEQESRVAFEGSIDISDGHEFDVESSEPVLEVGKTYTVVIDDAEYANLTAAADEWGGVMVGDRSYADYPFSIAAYPYEIYINMDPSIYARGPIYNIKIESTEETIHKIDEKYLPESGGEQPGSGVTVVAFEVDSNENVTGSLSPAQVKNAMLTSIVIGTKSVNGSDPVPIGPAFYDPTLDSVSFGLYYGSAGLQGIIISDPYGWNAG